MQTFCTKPNLSTLHNAFPQNFHTRKLGEISVFYVVLVLSILRFKLYFSRTGRLDSLKRKIPSRKQGYDFLMIYIFLHKFLRFIFTVVFQMLLAMFHKNCGSHFVNRMSHFCRFSILFKDLAKEIDHTKRQESKFDSVKLLIRTFFCSKLKFQKY